MQGKRPPRHAQIARECIGRTVPERLKGEGAEGACSVAAAQKGQNGGLSGSLPSFAAAGSLASLRLQGNSFTGPLPELPAGIQEVGLFWQDSMARQHEKRPTRAIKTGAGPYKSISCFSAAQALQIVVQ